jgi:hypothetical protein
MHDPMTVAFDIKRPWPTLTEADTSQRKIFGRLYWPTWITIWHVDPEVGGSDDSCGWSFPRPPKSFASDVKFWAGCEERDPWLLRDHSKRGPLSVVDAEAKARYVLRTVADRLHVSVDEAWIAREASRLIHNPVDNIRSMLCFVPGYHSNFPESDTEGRAESAAGIYYCAARVLLRHARPWYRHPRWHVWHWKIQIHPLQQLKRWAFSRCAGCGGRFSYGYAPTTFSWHGTGPKWFVSETDAYHRECADKRSQPREMVGA